MKAALMILLAVLTPFLLVTTLFAPPYAGILGAAYIVYEKGAAVHPLSGHLLDVFYIIDVYHQLFQYWLSHWSSVSIFHYTLPVTALPLAGTLLGIWLTRKASHKLMDLFHLSAAPPG